MAIKIEYRKILEREVNRLLIALAPVAARFPQIQFVSVPQIDDYLDEDEYWANIINANGDCPTFFVSLDNHMGYYAYFFGFVCKSRKLLDELTERQDEWLTPQVEIIDEDYDTNGIFKPTKKAALGFPIKEYDGHKNYYGMYDLGGHVSKNDPKLDVSKVVQFLASVLATLPQNSDGTDIKIPRRENDRAHHGVIKVRLGQPQFRKALLIAYGNKCAVTGCTVKQLLEAAHVRPHSEYGEYDLSNGILLRSDIHTLFDRNLLGIDPVTREVWIDRSINDTAYNDLPKRGPIHQPKNAKHQIKAEYLKARKNQKVWKD